MKRVVNCVVVTAVCILCVLGLRGTAVGQKPELVVQSGHSDNIDFVAFSPDGRLLASGSWDSTIKLWDVATGRELRTLAGHSGMVLSIAFSPDGKTLASGDGHYRTKLWDVVTGRELHTLKGQLDKIVSVAFSPDGKTLASGSRDNTIKLWEVATGRELRMLSGHGDDVYWLEFSADGKRLISHDSGNKSKLWDVATGQELRAFNRLYSIAFSADGKTLAAGSLDNTITLCEVATGRELRTLTGHTGAVNSIAFSADGKTLASGGGDNQIKLWAIASGRELRTLSGHTSPVVSVAFSVNGKTLKSISKETIKTWDVATGAELQTSVIPPGAPAIAVNGRGMSRLSKDRKVFATVTGFSEKIDVTIKLWNAETGTEMRTLRSQVRKVKAIALSADGQILASGGWDKDIKLWDLKTDKALGTITRPYREGTEHFMTSLTFSPDSRMLASGSMDGSIGVWDIATGKILHRFSDIGFVSCVAFSTNSRILASGGNNGGKIMLWSLATGKELRSSLGVYSAASAISFSPDGRTVAMGDMKGYVWLGDITSQKESSMLGGHTKSTSEEDYVSAVAFSPDGKILASAGRDRTIILWDVASEKRLFTLSRHANYVNSVAFSPDGKMLASGSSDKTIKLWVVADGTEARTLTGHSGIVTSVSFLADSQILASGSVDGTIKLWDTAQGTELATLVAIDERDWLVVAPDGLFDGSATAWKQVAWRFDNNTFNYSPVEAFFSDFFHPGLLTDILSGKRPKAKARLEEKDIRQPKVNLLRSDDRTDATSVTTPTVRVQVEVTEAPADKQKNLLPGGARDLRLFRNGSLVKVWRGDALALDQKDGCRKPQPGQVVCTAEVPIIAGENRFTAYAFNRDNVKSLDSELSVKGAESLKRDGTLYVLAIGINKYSNSSYDLKYAVADARDFGNELKAQQDKLKLYARTEIISLTDQEATKQNILLALRRLADGDRVSLPVNAPPSLKSIKQSQPEDAVVIYFAGHGTADKDRFYMIPHDLGITHGISALNEQSLKTLLAHSLSDAELESVIERVDAGQLLMIIDACNSGQALEAEEKRRGPMNSKGLAQLAYEKGMYILAAAQSYQSALGSARLGHGYLTYALVEEGLKTLDADTLPKDGAVTVREWLDYASERVPRMQEETAEKRDLVQPDAAARERKEAPQESIQRPRVFYRREAEVRPLIVVKSGIK